MSDSLANLPSFLTILQKSLQANDRARVRSLTLFPVRIGEGEGRSDLDENTFDQRYSDIWKPETVKAVMDQAPGHIDWSPGALFAHVGCGEVWFSKTAAGEFRISGFDISAYRSAGMSLRDCHRVQEFVGELQTAVIGNDRGHVAKMLKYPLTFHGQNKATTLHEERDVLREYDSVFSTKLRRAIEEQDVSKLTPQANGVAVGDGFLWINKMSESGPLKITSIFEPPGN